MGSDQHYNLAQLLEAMLERHFQFAGSQASCAAKDHHPVVRKFDLVRFYGFHMAAGNAQKLM